MAISAAPLSLLLTLLFSLLSPSAPTSSDLVTDLLTLESQSPSGVIRLSDPLVSRFLTSAAAPRPFSLLIFFDAAQLHDKSELRLKSLRSEFALLASSFIANNAHDPSSLSKLFFCDLEFRDAQSSFSLFGVNALPHIRLVPATAGNLKDDSHQMDAGDLSRLAESMAQFVESKTKLTIGPIHRPPMVSKTQLTVLIAALLIWVPFVVKKLISGDTLLHDPKVWLAGSVFVYFFSVSGAMHNIIRNMPMFMADRNDPSKLVFFYQGSGMQLGAEGFAVGSLYTVVGLLLAFVTHVLVRVRNVTVQRLVMIVSLLVSFWAVKMVVFLDNWKTGYGIHMYWPSSWQ
ncbi:probable dolichyl-diphosphooligosaccharide--protein glycosyltransferase subunit 3B [Actinidia eriantha]|uniref:probable dolichyl-diphosphooligosaccharide--protein glycosyltransferase subunit 3B n=1 Tax=Actinidia eriantha TaxID=165200 RepID=UPI002584F6C3|nr:probable dolichyl-diphosphooligosaccharide--protein glycosyltransferase subunit 3B [Actinidia eriantha]